MWKIIGHAAAGHDRLRVKAPAVPEFPAAVGYVGHGDDV
jgi:hypothetical protein